MKLNHKIKINLEEFITLGKFDFIKIGQTKEWILNNFPEPDDFGGGKSIDDATIWRYGNIEFHFIEDKLEMIFCDYIQDMIGGDSLELNVSFLHKLKNLTFDSISKKMMSLKVNYSVRHELSLDQVILKVAQSNIYMAFYRMNHEINDPNNFLLFAFWKK
ncbi:MAG: hypothetical protein MJK14_17535 [Rivularia sp. ALOHA_DT_140]|nr:hypothetical protein [Rivularia sp. ALOHA_DT_140]